MKKIIRTLQISVPVIFLALAIIGVARFPYAPIKKADAGYFDKFGHPQTVSEYESFQIWERALTTAGAALAVTAVSSALYHYRKHGARRVAGTPQPPSQPTPLKRRG